MSAGGVAGSADGRRVRVAVVGCGHLGSFHARLYHALPDAELVAVMDIVPEKARALGDSLGVGGTADLREALENAEAVSVATPTTTHAEVVGVCLVAGRHVLVEKPLAATVEEGERMVAAAHAARRVLAVGHIERFNPAFVAARGLVGAPRFVESHRLSTFVTRGLDVDVVLDLMIHDLDLTLSLLPEPLESIDAVGVPVLTAGEDIANARLRFQSGAVANLTASRVSQERVRKIRFFGARRYLSLDLMERRVEEVALEGIPAGAHEEPLPAAAAEGEAAELMAYLKERGLRLRHGEVPVPEANALQDELRDFLAAVRGAPLTGASGADGLRNLAVALEVRTRVRESLRRLGLEGPGGTAPAES